MVNITQPVDETWNGFEKLIWDWAEYLENIQEIAPYFAFLFSLLGLITAANLKTGTSTMPFLVTIGLGDVMNMAGSAVHGNDFLSKTLNILRSNIWGCRVTQTIVVQIAFHMSRLGFVGLAVDRFVAIVYPLKYRKWGKTSTGWITVAVFLAITVIVNGPYFMYTEVYKSGDQIVSCFPNVSFAYVVSMILINPVAPVLISLVFNVISSITLVKRRQGKRAARSIHASNGAFIAVTSKKDAAENRISVVLLATAFVASLSDVTSQLITIYYWRFNPDLDPIVAFVELPLVLNASSNFAFYMALKPMRAAFIRGITFGKMGQSH